MTTLDSADWLLPANPKFSLNSCSVFLNELHKLHTHKIYIRLGRSVELVSFELFQLFSYRLYTTSIFLQENFVNGEALISASDCLLKAQVINVTLEDLCAEPRMHTLGNHRPLKIFVSS
jgi:hypothetical protein